MQSLYREEWVIGLSIVFGNESHFISHILPQGAKICDELRQMLRCGRKYQEIKIKEVDIDKRFKDRDEGFCWFRVLPLGTLVGGTQEVELSESQQPLDILGQETVNVWIYVCTSCHFDGCCLLMWHICVTTVLQHVHQLWCKWFICSTSLTVAGSSVTWPAVVGTTMWWWITLKHISTVRLNNRAQFWKEATFIFKSLYIYVLLRVAIVHFLCWDL